MTSYLNNFDKLFAFGKFNSGHIKMQGSGHHVIIFDPSHIRKSGKSTFGKGCIWSGCDTQSKLGLEIGGITVGDVAHHTAFHFNTSLTAVSIAKSAHWLALPKEQREAFSMAYVKTIYHNQLLLERFFDVFDIDPDKHKNNPKVKELYYFGSIAT